MQKLILQLRLPLVLILIASGFGGHNDPMLGFSSKQAVQQRALETNFDALLNKDNLRTWMEQMTAAPQHVGSPQARANAEFMVQLFQSWGYEAQTEVYQVLFPTPITRELELLSPTPYKAKLQEPDIPEDASSSIRDNRLPPYNAYSADGEVTGELVYVNQGIPGDYEDLARMGIIVEGKIVIARYGGSWRGIKPKLAAEHGAIGCILYSDPKDDGFFQGQTYPEGSFRMDQGVQLGSVADMPLFPGDPLTPFIGATDDAERLELEDAPTLMRIPVLPISWSDAQPFLAALEGPVAPARWRGGLPLTYRVGPGPARVRLKLAFDWSLAPAYNVIAKLEGLEYPDEWVIRGNHRDAWVFGAQDPISGMVALMEEARAIGELAQAGHRPKRTIVYAGWDAEEPGLLGSTEWAEDHADELREKAVIYINSDSNGRGFLGAGGSHTLERLVNEVAASVEDPQTGVTVGERMRARRRVQGNSEVDKRMDLRISPLGSGSDYTPFLQHLGIATLNIGFGGENRGGSYHSAFDSFDYYVRFGDPGFEYGVALAQVAGRLTLRMANAEVMPIRLQNFAENVQGYVEEVIGLAADMRQETVRHNRMVETNSFALAADPTKLYVAPEMKDPVPYLNFAPIRNSIARVAESARVFDETIATQLEALSDAQRRNLNQQLIQLERTMTREEGLPGRPWFRHHIYAPGYYTGYGVKTLPGVREAIEQREWEEVEIQVKLLAEILNEVAMAIDQAADFMKPE
ncbi:MAG: M28 family peptidase [Bacteroidetes bacterium]|nr:M28 family peptidase [Bacteroidota bacterium]